MVRLQDDRWLLLMAAGLLIAGLGGLAWMGSQASEPRPVQQAGDQPSAGSTWAREDLRDLGQLALILGGIIVALPAAKLGDQLDDLSGTERYAARGHTAAFGLGCGLILVVVASLAAQGMSAAAILLVGAGVFAVVLGALAMAWLLDGVAEVSGLRRARVTIWVALALAILGGLLLWLDIGSEDLAAGVLLGIPGLLFATASLDAWWNGYD